MDEGPVARQKRKRRKKEEEADKKEKPQAYDDDGDVGTNDGVDGDGQTTLPSPGRHRICMVCDFFYPRFGGVEMHIWALSQCLLELGHKVIVVTHAYGDRRGVRCMSNGLKVYYCPLVTFVEQDVWPTMYAFFPLFRQILLREDITLVHTHQATSVMSIECALYAKTLGLKVVYTDHSLYGFTGNGAIQINRVTSFVLSDVDQCICVSNTCRENLALRVGHHPSMLSTIPNAVDPDSFTPDPSRRSPKGTVNIVIISRLVYRKGTDLLAKVIPVVCANNPDVHFIVGGDGNKKLLLDEMREKYQLHDRVELLGAVPHSKVRDVLVRGHIFLNCSLTESFCIAILEAACCGLFVVSTRVGGVPEVLPPSMIKFAEVDVASLVQALHDAIPLAAQVHPQDFHDQVRGMYSWMAVARRTLVVYDKAMARPPATLVDRLCRHASIGPWLRMLCCCVITTMYLVGQLLEWWWPREEVEAARDFPYEDYMKGEGPEAYHSYRIESLAPTKTKV